MYSFYCINYYYIYSFDFAIQIYFSLIFYPFLRSFRRFSENSTCLTFFLNFLILFSFFKFFNEMYYFYWSLFDCLIHLHKNSTGIFLFYNYLFLFISFIFDTI